METTDVTRRAAVHRRAEVATNRPEYRNTRKRETAVKVYTVNQESRYLIVQHVPALGAAKELITLFSLYGPIEEYRILDDYPEVGEFEEVYWIKFVNPADARFAKKKCNNYNFLGSELHVAYAPEYETVEDARVKFEERRKNVINKSHPRGERTQRPQPQPVAPQALPSPGLNQHYTTPYEQHAQAMQHYPVPTPPPALGKRKAEDAVPPPWKTPTQPPPQHPPTQTPTATQQAPMALGLDPSVNKTILSIRSKLSGTKPVPAPRRAPAAPVSRIPTPQGTAPAPAPNATQQQAPKRRRI